MNIDQGIMQGIGTILAMMAFVAVCLWAFSKHKKKDFDEASKLPFVDDELEVLKQDSSYQDSSYKGNKRNSGL